MLYDERVTTIMEKLNTSSIVKINDLSRDLKVSVDTIRRDLKNMENKGLLKCIRGGARLLENDVAFSAFMNRNILNVYQKIQAAKKAVNYVKNGYVITMNSGTTNRIIAEELIKNEYEITVVTNNIAVVSILTNQPSIKVIVPGGFLDPVEKSLYGLLCQQEFTKYNSDICFLSINAVSLEKGFSDFRFKEIEIMKTMANNSHNAIAVMDSSKFEKVSKQTIFPISSINTLISDNEISKELITMYAKNEIKII